MKAVILAAGRGTRLRDAHQAPKCLLPLPGGVLVDFYLDALRALGIPTTIVIGYQAADVRAHVGSRAAVIENPRYELGSIVSLSTALTAVEGPILLLDGDVRFDPALMRSLVASAPTDALLVDVGTRFTGEEYLAGVDADGRVRALRRGEVPGHATQGEWVGFAKLSAPTTALLRARIEEQIARGETAGGYEDALASLLGDVAFRCVPTNGLAWVEIDFPEDVERAAKLAIFDRTAGC